jgi:hypothetical protein
MTAAAIFPPVTFEDFLGDTPFANPRLPPQPFQSVDARTQALRSLKNYLAALQFWKEGANNTPVPFAIAAQDIHIEYPDAEDHIALPSITFGAGTTEYAFRGNTGFLLEETGDVYGKATALHVWAEHVETIPVRLWANDIVQLRGMLAGFQTAMNPFEEVSGIRLKLSRYFDRVALFSLEGGGRSPSEEAVRGRRTADLQVLLRLDLVHLVPAVELVPEVLVEVSGV